MLLRLLGADREVGDEHVGAGRRAGPGPRRPARPATPRRSGGSTCRGRRGSGPRSTGTPSSAHVGELDGVVLAGEDGLADVEADLGGVDVEGGDDLDVADVVAAEHDVHEAGDARRGRRRGSTRGPAPASWRSCPTPAMARRMVLMARSSWSGCGVLGAARERGALVGDELVEPGDVVLGWSGVSCSRRERR